LNVWKQICDKSDNLWIMRGKGREKVEVFMFVQTLIISTPFTITYKYYLYALYLLHISIIKY
jgi:hypothetical protein